MKSLLNYVVAGWLSLTAMIGQAAVDQADKLAPEPTVSVVWVFVFLVAFVAVCVGIGVGVYRAERAGKAAAAEKKN